MSTQIDGVGAEHELSFWRCFVTTDRFLDGWVKPVITPELQAPVVAAIGSRPAANVLDVGSGVVSILRGLVPDDKLTAVDPLSVEFQTFFDYAAHGIRPPLPVAAEDINFPGQFGIVHIRNALDHTNDPVAAYAALWRSVMPGGDLIVHGFANEANCENWVGLHKWNIDLIDGGLCVDGTAGRILTEFGADVALKSILGNGREWITWIKHKP